MLLLDVGNSRIKWALLASGELTQQGAAGIGEWAEVRQAFAGLSSPRKVLVSNVAGEPAAQQLRAICKAWGCPLEFIAAQQGFLNKAQANPYNIIPNYVMPGLANAHVATLVAGIVGVIIVFLVAVGVAYLRRNRTTSSTSSDS